MKLQKHLTIGLVSPYALVAGGVQNHITYLKKNLENLGHTVYTFAPRIDKEAPPDSKTFLLGKSLLLYTEGTLVPLGIWPQEGDRIKEIIDSIPFDIFHFHSPLISPTSWQIMSYAHTPIVITFHEAREKPSPLYHLARIPLSFISKKTQKMIAVSHAAAKTISPYLDNPLTIIPNGIDCARFSLAGPTHPWFDDTRFTLLFLGRLEERKGIRQLLQAYPQIKTHIPNVQLVVAGQGILEADVKQIIKDKSLLDVRLVGYVPEEEKPLYYRSCHVYCAPATQDESFGIVLLEAMSSGKAIVASANSGYKELLEKSGAGILVPPRDIHAFADAVIQLADNDKKRETMGKKGIEKARHYDWSILTPSIVAIYNEAITVYKRGKKEEQKPPLPTFADMWNQVVNSLKEKDELFAPKNQ